MPCSVMSPVVNALNAMLHAPHALESSSPNAMDARRVSSLRHNPIPASLDVFKGKSYSMECAIHALQDAPSVPPLKNAPPVSQDNSSMPMSAPQNVPQALMEPPMDNVPNAQLNVLPAPTRIPVSPALMDTSSMHQPPV